MTRWPRETETFSLVLSSPIGATLSSSRGTATIVANDRPAVATPVISDSSVTVSQTAGFAEFVMQLSAPGTNIVTVSYHDSNGTAISGTDYDAIGGTLKFAPGQTVQTVRVPIIDHMTAEPQKNFFFNLLNPANATIAAASTKVTGTITGGTAQVADTLSNWMSDPQIAFLPLAATAPSGKDLPHGAEIAELPNLAAHKIDLHLMDPIAALAIDPASPVASGPHGPPLHDSSAMAMIASHAVHHLNPPEPSLFSAGGTSTAG